METSTLESVLLGHEKRVYCVQLDENIVLSGSADKLIKQWDRRTLQCIGTLTGHGSSVMSLQFNHNRVSDFNQFTFAFFS